MAYVLVFSRCLLAVVFLVSAVSKLRDPPGFAASLAAVRVLPVRVVPPVAVVVTAAEAAVVPLVLAPRLVASVGFAVAAALLAAFTLAIVAVLRRGAATPCRCFGASSAPLARHHVVRNGLLIVVAGLGVVASLRGPTLDWPAVVLAGPPGILVAVLVVRLDDLVALFAPTTAALNRRAYRRTRRTSTPSSASAGKHPARRES